MRQRVSLVRRVETLVCGCSIEYDRAMIYLCRIHQDGNPAATQRLNQKLWGDQKA